MDEKRGHKERGPGIPDETSAVRATLIAIFKQAIGTGSDVEVLFTDTREASTSEGSWILSQTAIKLLLGDDLNQGDVDVCRRAVREMQGSASAA
jgi:hypothetical protein